MMKCLVMPSLTAVGMTGAMTVRTTSLLREGDIVAHGRRGMEQMATEVVSAIQRVPEGMLSAWHWKLSVAYALLWDYVETVCDLAADMRREQVKGVTRRMRELARKYRKDNEAMLSSAFMNLAETDAGGFEEALGDVLRDATRELKTEMMCAGMSERRRYWQMAVCHARIMLGAIVRFGLELDRRVDEVTPGVPAPACRLVDGTVLRLQGLLPQCMDAKFRMPSAAMDRAILTIGEELARGRVNTDSGEYV